MKGSMEYILFLYGRAGSGHLNVSKIVFHPYLRCQRFVDILEPNVES